MPLIGEARVAPAAVCSKRARTAVRLWRPIRSDLDVSKRAGALADARPPALQPERRGAPAVAVQRCREIAMWSREARGVRHDVCVCVYGCGEGRGGCLKRRRLWAVAKPAPAKRVAEF